MKTVLDCPIPFQLAHGGGQIQIEQTAAALQGAGVEVENLRWWDGAQTADIVHYFARPGWLYADLVKKAGRSLVISELLTAQSSWSTWRHLPNRILRQVNRWFGRPFDRRFNWHTYQIADAILALTPWEARLLVELYDAPPERIHVVPNGVEEVFFPVAGAPEVAREDFLVCTATITERKRVLELAEAAVAAQVPVWFIGKPYSESDPYFGCFLTLHRQHPQFVRYEGGITDRAQLAAIYRRARGFVLLSAMESLSLSALEAAAAGCPLLLGDLPWARCTFEGTASYCPVTPATATTAAVLKEFHRAAPSLPVPEKPKTWPEVGRQIKGIYETVVKGR